MTGSMAQVLFLADTKLLLTSAKTLNHNNNSRHSPQTVCLVWLSGAPNSLSPQTIHAVLSPVPTQGYGVIGGGEAGPNEVEGVCAFSLTLGQLPGVSHPF